MIDRPQWYTEGNLARNWERRLKPSQPYTPPTKRVWRWKSRASTYGWIIGLWTVGLIATVMAIQVVSMGYKVDALQTQYTNQLRQQAALQSQVVNLTTPTTLTQKAQTLHVAVTVPEVGGSGLSPVAVSQSNSLLDRVMTMVTKLRTTLVGK